MLEITPEVQDALEWFDFTHEIYRDDGIPHWRRCGLPRNGAVGSQDAYLMMTLDFLLQVHQTALTAEVRRQQESARRKAEAESRRG